MSEYTVFSHSFWNTNVLSTAQLHVRKTFEKLLEILPETEQTKVSLASSSIHSKWAEHIGSLKSLFSVEKLHLTAMTRIVR